MSPILHHNLTCLLLGAGILASKIVAGLSFQLPASKTARTSSSWKAHSEDFETGLTSEQLKAAASKFKIVTCMSTSCSRRRKNLGLDDLSTFAAFHSRSKKENDEPIVSVEEGPCLGACKQAPCVSVEHTDFVGSVALEGMTETEFSERVFHDIVTEEDADRVWSSVLSAIRIMAEEENGNE